MKKRKVLFALSNTMLPFVSLYNLTTNVNEWGLNLKWCLYIFFYLCIIFSLREQFSKTVYNKKKVHEKLKPQPVAGEREARYVRGRDRYVWRAYLSFFGFDRRTRTRAAVLTTELLKRIQAFEDDSSTWGRPVYLVAFHQWLGIHSTV